MSKEEKKEIPKKKNKLDCGIIMPISPIDGLSSEHWKEVFLIISDSVEMVDFNPNLVSNGTDVGVIQKRIIQNLYKNPIAVCDVSAKNSNVMFELGLRLAFDKPTIIIKDDKTNYSFDTSPIEHLEYPRDLRFSSIVKFKQELSKKISATYQASIDNPNYTTFLKHFGEYKISNLEEKEVTSDKYIMESIADLKREIKLLRISPNKSNNVDYANYFGKEELKSRVFNSKLKLFVDENNLTNEYEIKDAGLKGSLTDFLSGFEEIRRNFHSQTTLEKAIDEAIEYPDVPF